MEMKSLDNNALLRKKRRHQTWLLMKRNWILYLFILPAFLWIFIFHYVPIYGVQIAFQDYIPGQKFGTSEWVGLKYFKQFFDSYWFGTVMKNTIIISLLSFVLGFFPPIVLALLLNEVQNARVKKTVQTISYAPYFISTMVVCSMINFFLNPENGFLGIGINTIRSLLGMEEINVLMSGPLFKWIYALSGVWQGMGWGSIIYFAALSAVDVEQLDAARIDGASKLQRIWYINVPVLIPTIVIQMILACGGLISVGFDKTYLLQSSSILSYSEVISTYTFRAGLSGAKYSYGSAVGLFNNVVNSLLLILVNAIVKRLDKDLSLF